MQKGIKEEKYVVWRRDGMKPDERLLVLFKFGQEEHLTSFRQQGQMHMHTRRYFAETERENPARGDRFEGASNVYQPADLKMTFSHPAIGTHEVDSNDLAGPVILSYNIRAEQNIFCMFSLTAPMTEPLLHQDYLNFGSYFVLILNTPEFLRRVQEALKSLGLQGKAGLVEYYDEASYSGKVGPLLKPRRFAYQKEFRIITQPGLVPYRDLMIGDISDITSSVLPLSDIDRLVDFSEETATAGGWVKIESPNNLASDPKSD
jgi:hypothetical protein